jgi:hypothetical protein
MQRLPQSSRRKHGIESDRISGIQQYEVRVSMKREMLKPIIQNHTINRMAR